MASVEAVYEPNYRIISSSTGRVLIIYKGGLVLSIYGGEPYRVTHFNIPLLG